MPPENTRSLLATFQSVFPHLQIFSTIEKTDLVLIGSHSPLPLDPDRLTRGMMIPEVTSDLARVSVHTVADLLSYFKIGEEEVRTLVAGSTLNTDDNALIEFSAPLYLATQTRDQNHVMLNEATAGPVPYFLELEDPGMQAQFLKVLEEAYRKRGKTREADLVAQALPDRNPEPEEAP